MDVTTVAQDVLALIQAEGICLSDDLSELERIVRDKVLAIGARAIELKLSEKKLGYEGSSRACDNPQCKKNQKFVGHRPRTLATLLGQVSFKRAYYHCRHCGASCCPYDRAMGLGSGQESVGLAKAAAMVCAHEPFVPAARVLAELTGQRLADRTVHRITRKVGGVAAQQERDLALKMASWSIASGWVEAKPARLYVAVDGVMVHRQKWNEAKCVTCYWDQSDAAGKTHRVSRYAVRFESAEQFKAFVWSLACRCGLDLGQRTRGVAVARPIPTRAGIARAGTQTHAFAAQASGTARTGNLPAPPGPAPGLRPLPPGGLRHWLGPSRGRL